MCEYPYAYIGFIQWEVKKMKAVGDLTLFFGVTKWSNGLRREISCETIGAVPGSNPQKRVNILQPTENYYKKAKFLLIPLYIIFSPIKRGIS